MDYIKYLQTYSLDDILEYNDVDTEEVLELLVNEGYIKGFPNPYPVDVDAS